MNFATAADMLPVGSISKKIVSRKSHKIWKMTALPYISKYSYISRWLGSYIYYHLPPPWWIAKRNIKIMGGFGSYMLALACKKKVCVEEREVKGSQFVTQCHVKITPLIYFHLGTLCYYCYYYSLDLVGGAFFALQLFECNHLILFGYLILQGRYTYSIYAGTAYVKRTQV